jgi:hypothetical protein
VFVTDSTADEATREQVIARIARAAYDASLQSTSPAAGGTLERRIPDANFSKTGCARALRR